MMMAGTPCPYDGLIGDEAKAAWVTNENEMPQNKQSEGMRDSTKTLLGSSAVAGMLLLLLL